MIWLYIFLVVVPVTTVVYYLFDSIDCATHKDMTVLRCKTWDYGTFDQFVKQFESIEWENESRFPNSFFSVRQGIFDPTSKVHAGIFMFNGKGMVLKYWDYLKAMKYLKTKAAPFSKHKKGLWE